MQRTLPGVALVAASLSIAACSTMFPKQDPTPAPIGEIVVDVPETQSIQAKPPKPEAKQLVAKPAVPDQALPEPSAPIHTLAALPTEQIGYYMDIQEAKFRQLLGISDIEVRRVAETITLTVPVGISFELHRVELLESIQPLLAGIASVLLEFDKTLVTIHSHTDTTGAEVQNQQLSEQRGKSVERFMLDDGVASQRLLVIGHGETRPVAPNNSNHGRIQNRRIELVLEPIPL